MKVTSVYIKEVTHSGHIYCQVMLDHILALTDVCVKKASVEWGIHGVSIGIANITDPALLKEIETAVLAKYNGKWEDCGEFE